MVKEKQKVLILVTLAEIGGAQMSVLNLARELKRRDVDVIVAFGKGEFLEDKCRRYNIPTHRLKHLNRSLKLIENFRFLRELRCFLKKERFTVLHINSSNALLGAISAFSLLSKRPRTVFTYRGLSFLDENFEANRFKKFFYIALFHILTLFVDRQVFVSRANFESAKFLGLGRGGVVIYNGLPMMEVNFLEKNRAREKLEKLSGISLEKKMIVGSIGRLADQKNYEFLIKNWKDVTSKVPEAV
ncbi:MAG: glycosyltransferase, partial [Patescibacteria group bacterium]